MKSIIAILYFVTFASATIKPLHYAREGDAIPDSYIVVLKDGADIDTNINQLKTQLLLRGGMFSQQPRIDHTFNIINGFAAHLSKQAVQLLRYFDDVLYIEENAVDRIMQTDVTWGLDRIDQRQTTGDNTYNTITNGTGVTVYVIDTGILPTHEEFEDRASVGIDVVGGRDGIDCNGHGTHCAGTVGGKVYGVAKAVKLVGIRVLNCFGSGTKAQTIEGMDWVLANHDPSEGLAVVSMSLGGSPSDAQDEAVTTLYNNGIVVSVAAGNDDDDACKGSPSRAHDALSVGATDQNDVRAYFSNYGVCVDLFAPGVSITSAWNDADDDYNTISGTSMACPHVSGGAALVISRRPGITTKEVYSTIVQDATKQTVEDSMPGSPNLLLYVH